MHILCSTLSLEASEAVRDLSGKLEVIVLPYRKSVPLYDLCDGTSGALLSVSGGSFAAFGALLARTFHESNSKTVITAVRTKS